MTDNPDTDRSPAVFVTLTVLALSRMTVMANATIAQALPGLAAAFGDVPRIETLSGLVPSMPSIAIVLTAGIFGWLTDRIDRRTLLVAALAIYAVGGASGLFLDILPQILAGRVVLGIGIGGIMTVATMLAGKLWSGRARVAFVGRQSAAMSPVLAGLLGTVLSPGTVFPAFAAALGGAAILVRVHAGRSRPVTP